MLAKFQPMNTTQTQKQFRQGDVFVERIEAIPANVQKVESASDRVILAHGEVTGHHHSIEADAADWWLAADGEQFLEVRRPVDLRHQEHSAIGLDPGRYRVIRQREYIPGSARPVED
jgi:hypothetical protein